jgi:glycerophosphoryl diester phosphodiesterase
MTLLASALACLLAASLAPPPSPSPSARPGGGAAFDLQGHRGARGLAPENTLAAFARALGIGVTTLELDLAVTKDGVVVVSHDPRLNPDITRGPDGQWLTAPGPSIASLDQAALRTYDVGRLKPGTPYAQRYPEQAAADGARIPALAEVFALTRRAKNDAVRFNVETKLDPRAPDLTLAPDAFADAVVKAVRDAGMAARTTVQSFDWRTLKRVRAVAPEIQTVCLTVQRPGDDNVQTGQAGAPPTLAGLDVDEFGGSVPKVVKAAGCSTWSPNALDLTPEGVAEARRQGLKVVPWTVNDAAAIETILALGVDGLISDRPDVLRRVLVEKGYAVPAPTPVP